MSSNHLDAIMIIIQLILMSIMGMAVGFEFGAAYGWMAFVSAPLSVWIIREIKA